MDIQDRIKMVMKMHNKNASQFADTIDVQRSSISHILNGRNKPSLDLVQKILTHFPRVNADWLIIGKATSNPKTEKVEQTTIEIDKAIEKQAVPTESVINTEKKEIEKIIIFYKDGHFNQYLPNAQ